jgi:hypothetical protein
MLDQLRLNACQISYTNSIQHHGIVRRYLEEVQKEKEILTKYRLEANGIVDTWLKRWFNNPTDSALKEAKRIRNRIAIVTSDELKSFIRMYNKNGFNRAVTKLFEL